MTAVAVDPRLRARRVAVARAKGRRRLRRLITLLTVAALAAGTYWLIGSPLLDVDDISYNGLEKTSLDSVIEAAAVDKGTPLVRFDTGSRESRLEALPWVDTATVTRSWSGEVAIEITERSPVAAVMHAQDEWVLVDGSGRVLTGVLAEPPQVPKLSGVAAAGQAGSRLGNDANALLRLTALLPESMSGRVDGIYRDDVGELWISLNTADRVLFGAEDELSLKVISMVTVIEQLDAREQSGWELDVSVETLPVVRELRPELRPGDSG